MALDGTTFLTRFLVDPPVGGDTAIVSSCPAVWKNVEACSGIGATGVAVGHDMRGDSLRIV